MNARSLALAGLLAAGVMILLYMAMIVPNLKAVLYGLASLPMAVVVLETDRKTAVLFYLATAGLALILLPDKMAALPYVLVLGGYGFVKSLAETKTSRFLEWVLKLLYFDIALILYYFLIAKILFPAIVWPLSPVWLGLAAQGLFVLYDYVYSLAIHYYLRFLRPHIDSRLR